MTTRSSPSRDLAKIYARRRDARCTRCAASRSTIAPASSSRSWAVGLGQVDVDEPARLPRSPDAGSYLLDGQRRREADRARAVAHVRNREIGFVFQSFNLLARTCALENVELPLLYARRAGARSGASARGAALERVGLGERLDITRPAVGRPAAARGDRARAGHRAALLLADEPTGNLDTRTSIEIMGSSSSSTRERGITIVLVTHEPDVAEYARADRRVPRRPRAQDEPVRDAGDAATSCDARRLEARGRAALGARPCRSDHALRSRSRPFARNVLRTALTMLGIIIGVAAVIVMVAIGDRRAGVDRGADPQRRHEPGDRHGRLRRLRAASAAGRARRPR